MATIKDLTAKRYKLVNDIKAATTLDDLEKYQGMLKDVDAEIALVTKRAALLGQLGSQDGNPVKTGAVKTLGDHFVKHAEGKLVRGETFSYTAPVFVKDDPTPSVQVTPTGAGTYADALTTINPNIVEGKREKLMIADLFSQAQVTVGNSVTYYTENPEQVGDLGMVAENGVKPMVQFGDPVEHSENLKKIAGHYKVSDEVIDDAPLLASHINGRATDRYRIVENTQVLGGSGTGNNMTGLLNASGIQTANYAHGESIDLDTLLDAQSRIEDATDFSPDHILMNLTDYNVIRKLKDDNKRYLAGDPFGAYNGRPTIWGVPVDTTPRLVAGTITMGAFRDGGTIYRKRGMQVKVFNQTEDDALYNRITIVVEGRLLLAVERPACFIKITEAAS